MPATKTAPKPAKQPKKQPSKLDKDVWLLAALPFAAESGWRAEILAKAARKLGYDIALSKIVFPGGIRDLVKHFHDWSNGRMLEAIQADGGFRYMKVRQKVAFAVKARLQALERYQGAVKHLLLWSAVPTNAPIAARCLFELCSTIWYEAGDTSTDYNYYTKRGLLSAVYSSTLLFWLNDTSKGKAASWAFLDSRIDDVMQLGQKIGQIKQFGSIADKFMKMRRAA